MTRKLVEQIKQNVWASLIPAIFLSSSIFFLYYFQIYLLDPPMRFSLSDYGYFVLQFGFLFFSMFFLISNLMTLLAIYIRNTWSKLILYILFGVGLAPTIYPIFILTPFSYLDIFSVFVIGSVVFIGIYKEYKNIKN